MGVVRAVDVLETLELVGAHQHGLVSATQAQEAGVSKMMLSRLAGRGTLERVRHGVYSLPSAHADRHKNLRAAWVAAGAVAETVVSGESAARLHGLGDVLPSRHEFTSPIRRQTSQPDVRYRRRSLRTSDVVSVEGLPVTSVARTVADLAIGGTDFDHLAGVVRDAVDAPDTTAALLAKALDPAAAGFGHPDGAALLTALLKSTGYRPDTTLAELLPSATLLEALAPHLSWAVSKELTEQLQRVLLSSGLLERLANASEAYKADAVGDVVQRFLAGVARTGQPQEEMIRGAVRQMLERVEFPVVPPCQGTSPLLSQPAELDPSVGTETGEPKDGGEDKDTE